MSDANSERLFAQQTSEFARVTPVASSTLSTLADLTVALSGLANLNRLNLQAASIGQAAGPRLTDLHAEAVAVALDLLGVEMSSRLEALSADNIKARERIAELALGSS